MKNNNTPEYLHNEEGQSEQIAPQQEGKSKRWPFKMHLLRIALWLVPVILCEYGMYQYLWSQAEAYMPPVGYVFPREPVLIGEYRYKVEKYRHGTYSYVDETQIQCRSFSFYDGTFFQTEKDFDCNFLMKKLAGKQVEVHRVRLPKKINDGTPRVVQIISEGQMYLNLSDDEIRNRWIKDTKFCAIGTLFLVLPVVVFWLLSGGIVKGLLAQNNCAHKAL